MNKEQRGEKLIEVYQKWIQLKLNSPNFPNLSKEDILKIEAKKKYKEQYQKGREENPNVPEEDFKKIFEKTHGPFPDSLISMNGWFLISDVKEKDVSNIHYSFGFEDDEQTYWIEIALNSVASVEHFLAMNETEINEFFKLCKNKHPRMVLELNKKTKTNFAGAATHEILFEKEMCKLTEQDVHVVRIKANEINNLRNALIKPFIGLCVVRYLRKEEIAENFSQMENVFNFMKNLIPRSQRLKNTLREEHELKSRREELEVEIPQKSKLAEFMKSIGRFKDQERLEKAVIKLKEELEEINKSIKEKESLIVSLEQDMGGNKDE